MSLLQNSNAISAGGAYNITDSLRFRSSASAYLTRTPTTAGNRRVYTFSAWVKTASDGTFMYAKNGNYGTKIAFSANQFRVFEWQASVAVYWDVKTNAVYRDPSAWYHLVVAVDTTQATASNRVKLYVNGELVTSLATATYPSQNYDGTMNTTVDHFLGKQSTTVYGEQSFVDGYMTEVNFVDGQALTPSDFGETNADGVWSPKKYTGTYGTNGFYLNFSDGTSTTTLGYDYSGNSNNWTTNNISLTAGTTYDLMSDVPTLTDEDTGNFCTLNPLATNTVGVGTLSNANLNFSIPNTYTVIGNMSSSSGKFYWEVVGTTNALGVGIKQVNVLDRYSNSIYYTGAQLASGQKYVNGIGSAYGASWSAGDVIGVAVDMDGGNVTFYKNNVSQGAIALSLASITEFVPSMVSGAGVTFAGYVNFGQRPFAYTPPTGYKKLNTYNLPDSSIKDGSQYFDAKLWTGNGSTQSITSLGFSPDLVWGKQRNGGGAHYLYDSVRGATKHLNSDATYTEGTSTGLTSFDSDGFSLGSNSSMNGSTLTYVGWSWRGSDSTAVSNTDGTITSTVSANTTSGFSVVTYTGNGTSTSTVGHGLGSTPKVVITKNRTSAGDWRYWTTTVDGSFDYLFLNTTAAKGDVSGITAPTSSTFMLGNNADHNGSGQNYVAYCFAEVEGFSKFGSFTGNGSTNGPFIYTGFRPAFVIAKRSDGASDWFMLDSERPTFNVIGAGNGGQLAANQTYAESTLSTYAIADLLSNGFKIRHDMTYGYWNASGGNYIYMAFAENPFKNSLGR